MGLRYSFRKEIYRALLDIVVDRDGNPVTDRDGEVLTPRELIGAVGIYDVAPQGADGNATGAFPFITFGASTASEFDTNTRNGFDFLMRLHYHSRSTSLREIEDMQAAVYNRLHLRKHFVDDHHVILMRREQSDIMSRPDGHHHGVCEYRTLIEQLNQGGQ